MKTRIISGLIGLILLLTIVKIGGYTLKIGVLLITLIGIKEFINAFKNINVKVSKYIYIYAVVLFIFSIIGEYNMVNFSIVLNIITLLIIFVFNKNYNIQEISISLLGSIYIPYSLIHISYLDGNLAIWLIFIIAWSTDTFAYFIGNLIGKRKLSPNLSPKKTLEGAIGGIIGSFLTTTLFVVYFNLDKIVLFMLLSIVCSVASQIGDLTASKIKRNIGIKDYGKIMPGHGGVLDRFDSILFISPIIFIFITYLL